MKKIQLLTTAILIFAISLNAQVLIKGNFVVGSTVGFSTANSKVTSGNTEGQGLRARQFNIAPSIGYFAMDRLAVGIGADYTLNSVKEPNEDQTDDSNLLFGPFARYYVQTTDNVAFFVLADFGFGHSSDEQLVGSAKQAIQTNIFAMGVGPGITVFSEGGFGIEAIFKYNFAQSKFDTENAGIKTNTTTSSNQFALSLGMQFYFGGIKKVGGTESTIKF